MNNEEYVIYFENGQVLVINGSFDNAELVNSNKDVAIFIDEHNEYMIPMNKILYIRCTKN